MNKKLKIQAWHFRAEPNKLRDGSPSIAGVTERYNGKLILCKQGLHASIRPIDALGYAPGPYIARVECGGEIIKSDDKLVCSERTPLWIADATGVFRSFARWCARSVLHLWKAPPEVLRYINEEDLSEESRVACCHGSYLCHAASYAAYNAVYDNAYDAAYHASVATSYAAYDTAYYAARAPAANAPAAVRYAADAFIAARNNQNAQLEQMLLTLEV